MNKALRGLTANTTEYVTVHGTIVHSYTTPVAVMFTQVGGGLFFYAVKVCKPNGERSPTTAQHINRYKAKFDADNIVQCEVPLHEIEGLVRVMRKSHQLPPQEPAAVAQELLRLYGVN